ncbi:unnamed protein product [Oikopleura dioica]|uniref:Uncharacterized protein n=1 Tax=Oikopleura dioica TaxID=34765 RepID=E4Y746_OIKDI|nr:unnamed protein product [Oikopleura dioica]
MNFTQDFIENDTIFEEMIDNSTIQYEIVNSTDIFSADGSGDLNVIIEKQLNTHSIWESKFWLDIYFYFRDKILTNGSLPIMLLIGGIVLFCLVLIITVWMLCKIKKRRKGNGEYRPSEKEAIEMYFKFGHMRRSGFHTALPFIPYPDIERLI